MNKAQMIVNLSSVFSLNKLEESTRKNDRIVDDVLLDVCSVIKAIYISMELYEITPQVDSIYRKAVVELDEQGYKE